MASPTGRGGYAPADEVPDDYDEETTVMDNYRPEELQHAQNEFIKAFGYAPATDGDFAAFDLILQGVDAIELAAQNEAGGYDEETIRRVGIDAGEGAYFDPVADEAFKRKSMEAGGVGRPVISAEEQVLSQILGAPQPASRTPKVIPSGMAEDDLPYTDEFDYMGPDQYASRDNPVFEERMGPGSIGPSPTQLDRLLTPMLAGPPGAAMVGGMEQVQDLDPRLLQALIQTRR